MRCVSYKLLFDFFQCSTCFVLSPDPQFVTPRWSSCGSRTRSCGSASSGRAPRWTPLRCAACPPATSPSAAPAPTPPDGRRHGRTCTAASALVCQRAAAAAGGSRERRRQAHPPHPHRPHLISIVAAKTLMRGGAVAAAGSRKHQRQAELPHAHRLHLTAASTLVWARAPASCIEHLPGYCTDKCALNTKHPGSSGPAVLQAKDVSGCDRSVLGHASRLPVAWPFVWVFVCNLQK